MKTVFFDIDSQLDFLYPAGALYVPNAERIVPAIARLNRFAAAHGMPVVSTTDAHAENDPEFSVWPPHCVAGSPGADFGAALTLPAAAHIVSKATTRERDAYSGFQDTELARELRAGGCARVFIGGLATDYCVRATALDALRAGFRVVVLTDAVRAVDLQSGDGQRALAQLQAQGVQLATTTELLAEDGRGDASA